MCDIDKLQELAEEKYSENQYQYGEDPEQKLYFLPSSMEGNRSCVFICAGGSYSKVYSGIEGFPVGEALVKLGYHAVIVHYRTGEKARMPAPVADLAHAVAFTLEKAAKWKITPDRYAVMGFSAGGHLAGCFASESLGWKKYGLKRPAAVILGYPPVKVRDFVHHEFGRNILGEHLLEVTWQERYSLDRLITKEYPPVWLWQFDQDPEVPGLHSVILAEQLKQMGVPCKFRRYPGKIHGCALGKGTPAEGWFEDAMDFLKKQFEK